MNPVSYPSDYLPVVSTIDPQPVDNSTYVSDWVNMGTFNAVMFVLLLGAADIAINAKIRSAEDSSGTNAADITGLAMTALGGSDDNKQVVFVVRADQLNAGHTHVALSVTVGDGTTDYLAAVGIGIGSNYLPAADWDLSSVAEIVKL